MRAILICAAIVVLGCLIARWSPVAGVLAAFFLALLAGDRGWLDKRRA